MIKHYITKYREDGKLYVEAWLQLNILGINYCFSKKKMEIIPEKIVIKQEKEQEEKTESRFKTVRKRNKGKRR